MILLADSEGPDQTVRLCPKTRFTHGEAHLLKAGRIDEGEMLWLKYEQ